MYWWLVCVQTGGASYKLLTILNDARWQENISTTLIFEYEEILKRSSLELGLSFPDIDAIQVSALLTKDYLGKANQGDWEKFQRVLAKVPDVEPEEYDRL